MDEIAKREVEAMPWPPPPLPHMAAITPMAMIDKALASGAGIDVLEKLMALQERWEAGQARKAFDRAISEAKAAIPPIAKNREVDFSSAKGRTHYRHEDLAGIAKVIDPILSQHGLSYRYRSAQDGQTLTVTCILSHREGYSEETTLSAPFDMSGNKNAHQGVGSAATYLQRYTLKLALGLSAATDDDGRASGAPAERINAEQFRELRGAFDRTADPEGNEKRFLAYLDIEHLEDLPAAKFAAAMKTLAKKAQANG